MYLQERVSLVLAKHHGNMPIAAEKNAGSECLSYGSHFRCFFIFFAALVNGVLVFFYSAILSLLH